jgi:Secretion system C-terminal sorting domain
MPMKKNILSIVLIIFTSLMLSAQVEKKNDLTRPTISVYPNPASEFISVNHEESVKNIYVFNLVGRKMKNFEVEKGERYEIGDLPNGLYVIQLIGKDSKVLTTQRLTKKS